MFLCFLDYKKAFDMVSHEVLWKTMLTMGFSKHIVEFIQNIWSPISSSQNHVTNVVLRLI